MRATSTLLGVAVIAAAACGPATGTVAADEPLVVAAASNLMPAFDVLGERFEDATGEQVVFSYGSSGQLAQRLIEGAPMDVFAAADVAYVDEVVAAGRGDTSTQTTYAHGRIALWARDDAWGDWTDLEDLAADRSVTTVAIANPEHAPYGRAAREALESLESWDAVEDRLVFGENVTDTHRLAASGNADVALVALSLALAAEERGEGNWVLIDDDLHQPLQQDLVVTTDDPRRAELAADFVAFVDGADGREVMRRFGFLLPGERSPASRDE